MGIAIESTMLVVLRNMIAFLMIVSLQVEAGEKPAPQLITLSWEEFQKLPNGQKNQFMKSMAKILLRVDTKLRMSASNPESVFESMAQLENWFWTVLIPEARARRGGPDAMGGGVPLRGSPASRPECGVSSYAGYTCPAGQRICNPIIFGVRPGNETPVCYECATIQRCFNDIVVGVDTVLSPVFEQPGARETYNSLARVVNRHCKDQNGNFVEGSLGEDCRLFYRQYWVNQRKNINGEVRNLYAGTFIPGAPPAEEADEAIAEEDIDVTGGSEVTPGAQGTDEIVGETEDDTLTPDTDVAASAEEVEDNRPAATPAPAAPSGPPPLSQVSFNRCFNRLAQLQQAVGARELNRILGHWNLVNGSARLRSFTVAIQGGSLTLNAMGMNFRNATVCMSQPEGYYRLSVRSFLINEDVEIRLPRADTLISYKDDGSELTYRRETSGAALDRATAAADRGVL